MTRRQPLMQLFLLECIQEVERLFGARDNQYNFPTIQPQIDGRRGPMLDISKAPDLVVRLPDCFHLKDVVGAHWCIAHESVHVLDPHCNPTNYLEEGLATWFQNWKVKDYTGPFHDPWAEAERRVIPWMNVLPDAIKRFREEQRAKIGDVSEDMLVNYCPEVNNVALGLVETFPEKPVPRLVGLPKNNDTDCPTK